MLNVDFEIFYKRFHLSIECPYGKAKGCLRAAESGKAPTTAGCKDCWREYIEQKEPVDTGEIQGELFGVQNEI